MQDPKNSNPTNTNTFPFPPNDAPATLGGTDVTPSSQQPVSIPQEVPVTQPVVPASPQQVQPLVSTEPIAAPTSVVSTVTSDSYTPPILQTEPTLAVPTVVVPSPPVAIPEQTVVPEPVVMAPVPVAPSPQPVISVQEQPAAPPVQPLSSNHFPEEPLMPVMTPPSLPSQQVPEVSTVPSYQTVPVSQPPVPVQTMPSPAAPVVPAQSILTPLPSAQPVVQPMQQQAAGVPAASIAPSFAKKKSPMAKIALIAAALLLVLSGILFAIMQFSRGTNSTVGTKGEITWWGVTLDETDVTPIIEEYKTSHPDVKITYVKQSKVDYRERLTNALAKGTGAPDIFEMHNSWQPMFKNDLSTIPSSIMTPDEFKGTFYPVVVTDMTTTKGIIGIPLYYDALTLYVNEDIFSVALKTAPKTWIDVQNLANPQTGITQKDKDGKIIQSAIALGTTDNVEYWSDILGLMMYQNKASFTNFESPQTKDTLAFYQYFGKTTGNWDSTLPKSTESFAKGKTAMMIAPASAAFGIIQAAPTLHFKTYPLPQLPKENPSDPDVSYATYWSESVWAKSASKDTAWEFLKFASSGQTLQKVNQNLKTNSKPQRAYPIPSLNQQFVSDPILGSVVALAPVSKSWYLADQTNDGKTGLNTQLSTAFAGAFTDPKNAQVSVLKILNQYGIVIPK
jgi:ABC-type glycerol-3-phosphate transport system substrate-binding protein